MLRASKLLGACAGVVTSHHDAKFEVRQLIFTLALFISQDANYLICVIHARTLRPTPWDAERTVTVMVQCNSCTV